MGWSTNDSGPREEPHWGTSLGPLPYIDDLTSGEGRERRHRARDLHEA
jgi:hypothetical protein